MTHDFDKNEPNFAAPDGVGETPQQDRILLRLAEVAERCGVSERTAKGWVERDGLPVVRLPGRGARMITLVAVDDLAAWISQHRGVAAQEEQQTATVRLDGRRFIRHEAHPKVRGRRSA